jgi:hypothetical protein
MNRLKGFAIPMVILALVVISVGLAVWFASGDKAEAPMPLHNHPSTLPAEVPATKPTAKPKIKTYLLIKEWGVKFTDSGDPAGLTYGYDGSTARFDSKELRTFAAKYDNANSCANGALGSVSRTTAKPPQLADRNYGGEVARVGNYYYVYSHTTTFCSANAKIQAEQGRQHEALINQLKTLKAE